MLTYERSSGSARQETGDRQTSDVAREVSVIGRAWYTGKPSGALVAVARARTQMASCVTTVSLRNGRDHFIGWPMGTGGEPAG